MKRIVDAYLDKKAWNIVEYSTVLLKDYYKISKKRQKFLVKCLQKYFDDFVFKEGKKISKKDLKFLEENNARRDEHKKMMISIIDTLTETEEIVGNKKFLDNLFLISEMLSISYEIERLIMVSGEDKIKIAKILSLIREKYKPFYYKGVEFRLVYSNKKLVDLIRRNIKENREFYEKINKSSFFATYVEVGDGIFKSEIKNEKIINSKYKRIDIEEVLDNIKKIRTEKYSIALDDIYLKMILKSFEKRKIRFIMKLPEKDDEKFSEYNNLNSNIIVELKNLNNKKRKVKSIIQKGIRVAIRGPSVEELKEFESKNNLLVISDNKEINDYCDSNGIEIIKKTKSEKDVILEL